MIINDDGVIDYFEPRPFNEIRRDFAKLSLYSHKEVIRSIVKIKNLCQSLNRIDLFYFNDK